MASQGKCNSVQGPLLLVGLDSTYPGQGGSRCPIPSVYRVTWRKQPVAELCGPIQLTESTTWSMLQSENVAIAGEQLCNIPKPHGILRRSMGSIGIQIPSNVMQFDPASGL
ncbi:hypothetical protein SNK03_13573 [Fusarium graminearum]